MEILAYIAIGFLILRLGVLIANTLTVVSLKGGKGRGHQPRVSILIPARNEEKTIPDLLKDISCLDYPDFEVIIYDDDSNDGTAARVRSMSDHDERFKLIEGGFLPEGWLGKNHACFRLAREATGQYLLFLDADVRIAKTLLEDAVSRITGRNLLLLSVFPVQEMKSLGEWLSVPVMNWILVTHLPLLAVRATGISTLAAANGQFMLFEAANYREKQYHKQFRSDPVEDIKIIRQMKREGRRVETLLSSGQVSCRMYDSLPEAVKGFSKNVIEFFGGSGLLVLMYSIITGIGFWAVLLYMPTLTFLVYLGILAVMKAVSSILSHQPWLPNLLLFPLQQLVFAVMALNSLYQRITGKFTWKGRLIVNK